MLSHSVMKNSIYILLIALVCISCKEDDDNTNNNPNLITSPVNFNLNLDLPEYNNLNFDGNFIVLEQLGIRGIVVYNLNSDLYTAFDLADPNHPVTSCSTMIVDGVLASCPCDTDANVYDIITGQLQDPQPGTYPMLAYRVERNGNILRISN